VTPRNKVALLSPVGDFNGRHTVSPSPNFDAGIDVNKAGDLGYTPLRGACMQGNVEMVKLLIDKGANMFALSEGDAPFATARLAGRDEICDLLGPLMKQAQSREPMIWYLRNGKDRRFSATHLWRFHQRNRAGT
jgi:hypothetical protein